jgi:UDP-N-acetylmuramate dehydrogenase
VPFERPADNVSVAPFTTLGIGGPARWFARAASVEDVVAASRWRDAPVFVLGGGSNLVVSDEGFDGVMVLIAIQGIVATAAGTDTRVSAGAGESWDGLVSFAVKHGLAGIECLSGIPGTVGGTPLQNVGAYGQEVASVIEWVDAVDGETGATVRLSGTDCGFGYRTSRFKRNDAGRFIICNVTFRLRAGAAAKVTYPDLVTHFSARQEHSPDVRAVREAVLEIRRRKGMVIDAADPDTRSVGSFFMNPLVTRPVFERIASAPGYPMQNDTVKIPAAWLIEHSGFGRGYVDGAVGLSTKHPLALINRGGATARDVIRLACRIKRAVMDRFGILLRPEPVFVGFGDDAEIEYLRG